MKLISGIPISCSGSLTAILTTTKNSARFGWRWIDGKIDIIAYCYTSGERTIEKIGETSPNIRDYYEIGLTDTEYVFKFNTTEYRVPRNKPCDKGAYYLLFPFLSAGTR